MVGTSTLFTLRDLVVERIDSGGAPNLDEIADVMKAHPDFSYFGALGLGIFDFLPDENPYVRIWREVFELLTFHNVSEEQLAAAGVVDTEQTPSNTVLSILNRIRSLVSRVSELADDEKLFELGLLRDELEQLAGDDRARFDLFGKLILEGGLLQRIGALIFDNMRPAATPEGVALLPPTSRAIPALASWGLRESTYASKTGELADELVHRADDSGDDSFRAYAYGFHIAFVGQAVGAPFVNSIIGSTPRLHWWRARWISRHVDAWVWGFYGPGQSANAPPFDYASFRSLCNAELHKRVGLGELGGANPHDVMLRAVRDEPLPAALDDAFRTFWIGAFRKVYGEELSFGLVDGQSLNSALVWSWLALWFNTSPQALGCNPPPPLSIADGTAFFDPGTVDPFIPDDAPPPVGDEDAEDPDLLDVEPELEPDKKRTACGVILAILGLFTAIWGPLLIGLGTLVGGVLLVIRGEAEINWKKLRQDLYVVRWAIFNNVDGLQRMLSWAGLSYPKAADLAESNLQVVLPSAPDVDYQSGEILIRSVRRFWDFPARAWTALDSDWVRQPSNAAANLEQSTTIGFGEARYPSYFIDDAGNPLSNGSVRDVFTYPPPGSGSSAFITYGNAVDNCIDSLGRLDEDLPNLNMHGDRGLGHRTWRFTDNVYQEPVSIEPEA